MEGGGMIGFAILLATKVLYRANTVPLALQQTRVYFDYSALGEIHNHGWGRCEETILKAPYRTTDRFHLVITKIDTTLER